MNKQCLCKVINGRLITLKPLGVITVLLGIIWQPAFGFELADYFKRADQRAVELLEQGKPDEAAALFTDDQWRGVSRYQAGKYQEAMEDFNSEDLNNNELEGADKARALFNHGTAAARARDYNKAVSSLESAVQLAPDNLEFQQNLDIAKKLKDLAEKNQSQQESESDENSEGDQQQEDKDGEESQEQESEQQESEQQDNSESSESDQQGQEGQNTDENGELSNDAAQSQSNSQSEPPLELDDFKDPAEQAADPQEQGEPQEAEGTAVAQTEVSEDDQAAQQWLRRIPDDPSQLLRNKIRLNHMIEYPDVNHMQEPW